MEDLERRVARLERRRAGSTDTPAAGADPERLWALDVLRTRDLPEPSGHDAGGSVLFAGVVRGREGPLAGWQEERPVAALLALDWSAASLTLSALAHPMRLELVRHLLRGARTAGELATIPGLGTSGQLYHHLKELQRAGLVVQPRRNEYVVPPERMVQCLVVVAAAASQAPREAAPGDAAPGPAR